MVECRLAAPRPYQDTVVIGNSSWHSTTPWCDRQLPADHVSTCQCHVLFGIYDTYRMSDLSSKCFWLKPNSGSCIRLDYCNLLLFSRLLPAYHHHWPSSNSATCGVTRTNTTHSLLLDHVPGTTCLPTYMILNLLYWNCTGCWRHTVLLRTALPVDCCITFHLHVSDYILNWYINATVFCEKASIHCKFLADL